MSFLIKKGTTDVTRYVMLRDSTAGTPETGYTITDLDLQYTRNRAEPAAKVDATALADQDDAHADNQAIQIDATSSPGLYRVDWPDAAFATGADKVLLVVSGAGLDPAVEEIQLVDYDPQDAVRLGLTSLPNAAADAAGGLPISDAGGLDLDNRMPAAASVTNMNVVFNTDFATNYDTTLDMWNVDVAYIAGIAAPVPITGTADSGTSTTMTDAARTDADDDYWKGSWILFTSGTISGQCRLITAFNAGTDTITFSPATTQDVSTNTYEIIPAGRVDAGLIAGQTITAAAGVTFPTSVASPTNITAGTITTVTNLTNAPTVGDLTATMKASVNTEVLDVLNVDTFAEPGQEAPAATNTLVKKIGYIYKFLRNKITQTSSQLSVYADDGSTVDQKAAVTDDGTTTTRAEIGSGP
jgi:hypothetical protein